ncbi:MAG TPA: antibiotic biosynthesis monooxygenase [Dehalococcoidia bacterium]
MPLYITADYKVRPDGAAKVRAAIDEFVRYVKANEPATRLYMAWERKDEPGRFMHFFIFEDQSAQDIHSESAAVKKFESVYGPELVGGDVVFTDFELVARN